MTNGDRLRKSDDRELAREISCMTGFPANPEEVAFWYNWLQKEETPPGTIYDPDMTSSHSEKEILNGCIALMQSLMGRFEEYLDYIDFKPDSEEERFGTQFYLTEIVERLFLWKTHHSGGTSQLMKLRELGEERKTVTFEDERYKEELEEEDSDD